MGSAVIVPGLEGDVGVPRRRLRTFTSTAIAIANATSPPIIPVEEVAAVNNRNRSTSERRVYRQRWRRPVCGGSVADSLGFLLGADLSTTANDITRTCVLLSCSFIPPTVVLGGGGSEMT